MARTQTTQQKGKKERVKYLSRHCSHEDKSLKTTHMKARSTSSVMKESPWKACGGTTDLLEWRHNLCTDLPGEKPESPVPRTSEVGTPARCRRECNTARPVWKTVWRLLVKLFTYHRTLVSTQEKGTQIPTKYLHVRVFGGLIDNGPKLKTAPMSIR